MSGIGGTRLAAANAVVAAIENGSTTSSYPLARLAAARSKSLGPDGRQRARNLARRLVTVRKDEASCVRSLRLLFEAVAPNEPDNEILTEAEAAE
jgi:hypothetical protein